MDDLGPRWRSSGSGDGGPRSERSNEWGRNTSAVVPITLIPVCFGVLLARFIWPAQLTHGVVNYLLAMLFFAAAIESVLEAISGFIWGPRARYVRGALLGVAALMYSVIPT
jgi:cell shape-determining protein MreD